MPDKVALVVGASGIVGRALLNVLVEPQASARLMLVNSNDMLGGPPPLLVAGLGQAPQQERGQTKMIKTIIGIIYHGVFVTTGFLIAKTAPAKRN